MAAVAAAALGMVPIVWDEPPPGVRVPFIRFWLIVPLVGILWDRWRGGRGVLGGALGGAVYAGFALIWVITGPHMPGQMGPSYLANSLVAVHSNRRLPHLRHADGCRGLARGCHDGTIRSPTLPSPEDRFVRQR